MDPQTDREVELPGTVQKRYEVNLKKVGFNNRYRIDITVDHKELKMKYPEPEPKRKNTKAAGIQKLTTSPQEKLAQDIMALNKKYEDVIIEDVAVLMGDPADLSATVWTRGEQDVIFRYVTAVIRPLDGVQSTSTCIEGWSISQERIKNQAEEAEREMRRRQASEAKKRRAKRAAKKAQSGGATPKTPVLGSV